MANVCVLKIVDSNDENFMKNIVAYGTVVQHPPNIIVPDDRWRGRKGY